LVSDEYWQKAKEHFLGDSPLEGSGEELLESIANYLSRCIESGKTR